MIAFDQATKAWAVANLQGQDPVVVIPQVLSLTFVLNPGAAFGMATGYTWLLALFALGISTYMLFVARSLNSRLWGLALALLFAGAVGNLLDRIFRAPGFMRGHVVDFLQFTFIDFPVFNFADNAITFGAILVVLQSVRGIGVNGERGTS